MAYTYGANISWNSNNIYYIIKKEGAYHPSHKLMKAIASNSNRAKLAEESHGCAVSFDTLIEESAMILVRTCASMSFAER